MRKHVPESGGPSLTLVAGVALTAVSLALMAVCFPLRRPMLMAFGASGATYGYANTYFTVYLCGTVFNLLELDFGEFKEMKELRIIASEADAAGGIFALAAHV